MVHQITDLQKDIARLQVENDELDCLRSESARWAQKEDQPYLLIKYPRYFVGKFIQGDRYDFDIGFDRYQVVCFTIRSSIELIPFDIQFILLVGMIAIGLVHP